MKLKMILELDKICLNFRKNDFHTCKMTFLLNGLSSVSLLDGTISGLLYFYSSYNVGPHQTMRSRSSDLHLHCLSAREKIVHFIASHGII